MKFIYSKNKTHHFGGELSLKSIFYVKFLHFVRCVNFYAEAVFFFVLNCTLVEIKHMLGVCSPFAILKCTNWALKLEWKMHQNIFLNGEMIANEEMIFSQDFFLQQNIKNFTWRHAAIASLSYSCLSLFLPQISLKNACSLSILFQYTLLFYKLLLYDFFTRYFHLRSSSLSGQ